VCADDPGARAAVPGARRRSFPRSCSARRIEALHFFLWTGAILRHDRLAARDAHGRADCDAFGGDDGFPAGAVRGRRLRARVAAAALASAAARASACSSAPATSPASTPVA
jgi:hypothetical protein